MLHRCRTTERTRSSWRGSSSRHRLRRASCAVTGARRGGAATASASTSSSTTPPTSVGSQRAKGAPTLFAHSFGGLVATLAVLEGRIHPKAPALAPFFERGMEVPEAKKLAAKVAARSPDVRAPSGPRQDVTHAWCARAPHEDPPFGEGDGPLVRRGAGRAGEGEGGRVVARRCSPFVAGRRHGREPGCHAAVVEATSTDKTIDERRQASGVNEADWKDLADGLPVAPTTPERASRARRTARPGQSNHGGGLAPTPSGASPHGAISGSSRGRVRSCRTPCTGCSHCALVEQSLMLPEVHFQMTHSADTLVAAERCRTWEVEVRPTSGSPASLPIMQQMAELQWLLPAQCH